MYTDMHRYALTAAGLQQLVLANPTGVHLGSGRKHALAIGSYVQELSDRVSFQIMPRGALEALHQLS